MITSLQERKNEKMLEAARVALATEARKPLCQMDTVFMRKCIEIISGKGLDEDAAKKRPGLWGTFLEFLCGE